MLKPVCEATLLLNKSYLTKMLDGPLYFQGRDDIYVDSLNISIKALKILVTQTHIDHKLTEHGSSSSIFRLLSLLSALPCYTPPLPTQQPTGTGVTYTHSPWPSFIQSASAGEVTCPPGGGTWPWQKDGREAWGMRVKVRGTDKCLTKKRKRGQCLSLPSYSCINHAGLGTSCYCCC